MLSFIAVASLVFSVSLIVIAVYEKLPTWVIVGLFGNVAHSIIFVLRALS